MTAPQPVLVLMIGGLAQTLILVLVLVIYSKRSALGVQLAKLDTRMERHVRDLRLEMQQGNRDLRRYVDESVSSVSVESQVRDTDLRARFEADLKELLQLPKRCEEAMYQALNRVMGEKADEKARQHAERANELMLRAQQEKKLGG